MRVLMLASYFPKPENRLMGNWALSQGQAFLRSGMDVLVVSGTSWVPKMIARTAGARSYSNCPQTFKWGELLVEYPRWLFYSARSLNAVLRSNPKILLVPAWWSVRKHLLRTLQEFKPDVIYAHHTQVNGYIAWRLHRITGIPYVITDHDLGEIEECRNFPKRKLFFSKIVSNCSCMVSVAERMERLIHDIFPQAVVKTVHNGAEYPSRAALATPRPVELGSRLVIFSACKFYERKGIPLLVSAFGRIASKFPHSVLRIAGDGETRAQIEEAIQRADVRQQVQLLGSISNEQVLQEMVWADLFALPGWDEPFATVFSEALSASCPIIYSVDGGISDVAVDKVHGIAVEPRSEESLARALEVMLSDEHLRAAMGKAAKELFDRELLWDRNARQMKSIFAGAILEHTATQTTKGQPVDSSIPAC